MPNYKFTNKASSLLAGSILAADTSLSVSPAEGSLFPNPGAGEAFRCFLYDAGGNEEIIEVTGRTGDSFDAITRGLEGTTARDWAAGTVVSHRMTAGIYETWREQFDGNNYAYMASAFGTDEEIAIADGAAKAVKGSGTLLSSLATTAALALKADATTIGNKGAVQSKTSAAETLAVADVGKLSLMNYAGTQTATLPDPSTVVNGACISLYTGDSTICQVSTAAGTMQGRTFAGLRNAIGEQRLEDARRWLGLRSGEAIQSW